MIVKLDNKSDNFYKYMGKFFGSRIVQLETNDRLYDDNNKIWYIFLKEETPVAFVSLVKNTIKNIYSINTKDLEDLLLQIKEDTIISPSIVTRLYTEVYTACGFVVEDDKQYKNFVVIRSDMNEQEQEKDNFSGAKCQNG